MNKKFKKAIDEAKKVVALLRLKNEHRIKVAEIALSVCTIRHGGRVETDRATVKIFAEKIGVNPKTLYEWIRYKEMVFDKLTADQRVRYMEVSADTLKEVIAGIKPRSPESVVQRRFNQAAARGPVESKLKKYSKVMDTIIFNLSTFQKAHEVPDDMLTEFLIKARTIDRLVVKTLDMKQSGIEPSKKRVNIDWDNFFEGHVFDSE